MSGARDGAGSASVHTSSTHPRRGTLVVCAAVTIATALTPLPLSPLPQTTRTTRACALQLLQPLPPPQVTKNCDVLFVSVKPQYVAEVLREAAPHLTGRHVVVSIAAGIPLEK